MDVDIFDNTLILTFKGEECSKIKEKINLKPIRCYGYSGHAKLTTPPCRPIFYSCFVKKGYELCGEKTERIKVWLINIKDVLKLEIRYFTLKKVGGWEYLCFYESESDVAEIFLNTMDFLKWIEDEFRARDIYDYVFCSVKLGIIK